MARVAIVIVTWNSEAEIDCCLASLNGLGTDAAEIVVVDNASSDGTVAAARKHGVNVIANPHNRGFAAAVNQGVGSSTAPLILLLNPDAQLIGAVGGLESMALRFSDPGVGAVGGLLVGLDGKPQQGFMVRSFPTPLTLICEVLGINRLWPRNPVNWHYRCLSSDPMAEALVDQPAGAFVMFSRAAWEKVGGVDERFWPLWFEDVDFFRRLKSAGFFIIYTPLACAKHTGSHSIRGLRLENRETYWYGNLLEYAARHYGWAAYHSVCMAVAVGAGLRVVWGIPRFGLKAIEVYSRVLRLSLVHFFRPRTGNRKPLS